MQFENNAHHHNSIIEDHYL